nr:unnamed protein product [Callosobruchus analis]
MSCLCCSLQLLQRQGKSQGRHKTTIFRGKIYGLQHLSGFCKISDKVGPTELHQFGHDVRADVVKRKPTDTLFLTLFAVFLVVFLGFLAYCIINGDLYRVVNGYDDCGYICGKTNKLNNDSYCTERDKTSKKYHILIKNPNYIQVQRQCVESCPSQ